MGLQWGFTEAWTRRDAAVPRARRRPPVERELLAQANAEINGVGSNLNQIARTLNIAALEDKKRHILVDTQGLLMQAIVHTADIQDRDGGVLLMGVLFGLYPFFLKLYADSGYQGAKFQDGLSKVCRQVRVEIVKRCDLHKFVVLPKRWIVERTIAWLNRCRRFAKDWECLDRNGRAFLRWASVRLMLRRLC